MNIIVTIPKSEKKNIDKEEGFAKENSGEITQFWKIGRKPQNLNVGDKVYFVEDGLITCYQIFQGFEENPYCEVTDRIWEGLNLILIYPPIYLDKPIPMKGFQGFRYTEDLW